MTKHKARSSFTISSHLHILPFSIKRSISTSQYTHTKSKHPCPTRSISQPLPTPSTSPPKTPRLRRVRPPRSSLRSSNHPGRIFSFTSQCQHRRPHRRSQSHKDRHAPPHHRRGHCSRRSSPNTSHHWSLHADAVGHRMPTLIPGQPAAKVAPLHTRPYVVPARAVPRNHAARNRRMDYGSNPHHRR